MSTKNGTAKSNGAVKRTKISKQTRTDGPWGFSYEQERSDTASDIYGATIYRDLYELANKYEEGTVFDLGALTSAEQLGHLEGEIKVRISITKQEIFKIGELLTWAKNICQQEDISYKKWIEDNFDFSYETANNFRNVFKYCFAQRRLAIKLPTTILYKVSKPKFPDELRAWLFEHGELENISNGELRSLVRKYKKDGIEAVEGSVNELSRAKRIARQIQYTFDQFENALRTLTVLKEKMEAGESGRNRMSDFYSKIEGDEPEAQEIEQTLFDALVKAYKVLDQANVEAKGLFNKCRNKPLSELV